MSQRRIVGFGFQAGAGKDTAGMYLVTRYGFHIDFFARPLKEAAKVIWGFSDEQLYGAKKEEIDPFWGYSARTAMQRLGTEIGRTIDENVWAKQWLRRTRASSRDVAVTDVRFSNETKVVQEAGGKLVCIYRPGLPERDHPSETALRNFIGWDATVHNDGTLEQFYERLDDVMTQFGWTPLP